MIKTISKTLTGHHYIFSALSALIIFSLAGCETLQTLGKEQREKLQFHVAKAETEQEEAKEQFRSAYEEFASLIGYEGSEIEEKYEQIRDEYEASVHQAEQVHDRIEKIESVAEELFEEWRNELDEYQSSSLRNTSEELLYKTQSRYRNFIASMKRVEAKMDPVIEIFHDQVLFLKHNLNASAVAALKDNVYALEGEVATLIIEIEDSIANAREFITTMETP